MKALKVGLAGILIVTSLIVSALAHATETSTEIYNPVGLGTLFGVADGHNDYRFLIEGQNHFSQGVGRYGVSQYGHGQSRLEIGNGVGITLAATSGITVFGLKKGQNFSSFFGVEPMSGHISIDSNRSRENFYEWLPAASVGLQARVGSCRLLPLLRGGGGVGNVAKEGFLPSIRPTFGAGAYINCARLDLAAEITRIVGQAQNVNLALVDIGYALSPNGLKLGVRGENNQAAGTEQRVMLLIRSKIGGLN